MKKIYLLLTIFLLITTTANLFYTYNSQVKLAYIDSNRLLNHYKGMQDARKEFEQKISRSERDLDTLSKELQTMHVDFEKKKSTLSERERILSSELLKTKQQQFQSYRQALQERLKSEDEKLTAQVLNKVNGLIKNYGDKYGYTIIFGAMADGNIVYGNKGLDLTEAIIDLANAEYNNK